MDGHISDYNHITGHPIRQYPDRKADGGHIGEYHRADAFDFRYADNYDCYNDPDVLAGTISLDDCIAKHINSNESIADYEDKYSSENRSKFNKWLDGINRLLDVGDRTADVVHKWQNDGTQTEVDGIQYDTTFGQKEQPKTDLTGWYIAGGVIVLLVIAGVVIKNKK